MSKKRKTINKKDFKNNRNHPIRKASAEIIEKIIELELKDQLDFEYDNNYEEFPENDSIPFYNELEDSITNIIVKNLKTLSKWPN